MVDVIADFSQHIEELHLLDFAENGRKAKKSVIIELVKSFSYSCIFVRS